MRWEALLSIAWNLCLLSASAAEQGRMFLFIADLSQWREIWIGREESMWNLLRPSLRAKEPSDACWSVWSLGMAT